MPRSTPIANEEDIYLGHTRNRKSGLRWSMTSRHARVFLERLRPDSRFASPREVCSRLPRSRLWCAGGGTATCRLFDGTAEVVIWGVDTRRIWRSLLRTLARPEVAGIRMALRTRWRTTAFRLVARLEQAFRRIRPDEVNAPGTSSGSINTVNGGCARSPNAEPRRLLFQGLCGVFMSSTATAWLCLTTIRRIGAFGRATHARAS